MENIPETGRWIKFTVGMHGREFKGKVTGTEEVESFEMNAFGSFTENVLQVQFVYDDGSEDSMPVQELSKANWRYSPGPKSNR